jgi:hypothetical protein
MSLLAVPKRPRVRLNRPLWRQSLRDGLYNGLVDAWNLNEAAGNMAIGALGHHLTDNNTVATAAGVSAHTGNARAFTRTSSHRFSRANALIGRLSPGTHDFSGCYWVYPTEDSQGSYFHLGVHNPGSGKREWHIAYISGGTDRYRFTLSDDGAATDHLLANNYGAVSLNAWVFIIFDYRASDGRQRISGNNGTLDSQTHSGGVFQGTADFEVGGRTSSSTPGLFHDGRIGGFCFWDRLLTDQEHTLLYNGGVGWGYPF